jgi:hypothetical protein
MFWLDAESPRDAFPWFRNIVKPYTRTGCHIRIGNPGLGFNEEWRRGLTEIASVQGTVDGKRLTNLGRPIGERFSGGTTSASTHYLAALQRYQSPDQDRGGKTIPLGDEIEHPVHAVSEVYVCVARRSPHRLVTRRTSDARVATKIIGANVSFRLNDQSG